MTSSDTRLCYPSIHLSIHSAGEQHLGGRFGPTKEEASTEQSKGEGRAGAGTHLLGDQVIEQGDHTHGQDLRRLLLHEAPEDLQPPQLQELLLGVGEVAQQGTQSKQDLGGTGRDK